MKKEIIQFVMPNDAETFIAALAVVEAYEYQCLNEKGVTQSYEIHLENVPKGREFLVKPQFKLGYYTGKKDLEFVFDSVRAKTVATATKKHVTEAFAIMLGIKPESLFPSTLTLCESQKKVVVLNEVPDLTELLSINLFEYEILNITPAEDMFEHQVNLIRSAEIVIGKRSALTYVACAMHKKVIEWSEDPYTQWLSKWENPNYRPFEVNQKLKLTASLILRFIMNSNIARAT